MSKRSKKLKKALLAGAAMYGAAKLFGGNNMVSGKDSEVGAIAKQRDKLRVPASVKNRKKFKDAFMPKGNIMGQDFGIDPFGPGMGAKKGKMIKAMGGTMVTRGQGRVIRVKKTQLI
jgi:hypothetical protein